MTFTIESIEYRRQEVDRGVILGVTEYKSDLVRTKSPLQCEDLQDNTRIDCLSPHKKNIVVYVPAFYLREGVKIRTLTGQDGHCQYKTYLIKEVSDYHVEADLLNVEEQVFQRRALARSARVPVDNPVPFEEENPFLSGSVCAAGVSPKMPDVLKVGRKTFVKKTNYIFLHTENQKRKGSVFEKVSPDRIVAIYGDTAVIQFSSGPSEIDILTGRRILKTRRIHEERKHILETVGKVSPSYRLAA